MMLTRLIFVLALFGFAVWPSLPASTKSSPSAAVETLNAALLDVMQNADLLGYQGRFDVLAPQLKQVFAFQEMARISVSRFWSELDEVQKQLLAREFALLSISTFAARFDSFKGESFQVVGEKRHQRGSIQVLNRLIRPNNIPITLDFLVKEVDGEWRIIDVFLDGKYSELAMKRSEYTSVISRYGFSRLVSLMKEKTAEMGKGHHY